MEAELCAWAERRRRRDAELTSVQSRMGHVPWQGLRWRKSYSPLVEVSGQGVRHAIQKGSEDRIMFEMTLEQW